MASQLNSDDFRNVGQALVMHNSLDILIAIKLILGWDVFFRSASPGLKKWREDVRNEFSSRLDGKVPGVYPRAELAEGRRALRRQNLGVERLEKKDARE